MENMLLLVNIKMDFIDFSNIPWLDSISFIEKKINEQKNARSAVVKNDCCTLTFKLAIIVSKF